MERKIVTTRDGSQTLEFADMRGTYHSRHGALEESRHVFINAGLLWAMDQFPRVPLSVFEMGFGTGLNALLTAVAARERQTPVQYLAVEAFPVPEAEAVQLNYGELLAERSLFRHLHAAPWGMETQLSEFFAIRKEAVAVEDLQLTELVHVIYYDAFAPSSQPELWTAEAFRRMHERLLPGGVLTTYCSKTVVRRAMESAGFVVSKPPGPWGKREMVRATSPRSLRDRPSSEGEGG